MLVPSFRAIRAAGKKEPKSEWRVRFANRCKFSPVTPDSSDLIQINMVGVVVGMKSTIVIKSN